MPVSLVRPVLSLGRVRPRLRHLLPPVGVRVQDEQVDGRLHLVVVARAVAPEAVDPVAWEMPTLAELKVHIKKK